MKTMLKEESSFKEFSLQKKVQAGLSFVSKGNSFAPELSKEFSYSYIIKKGKTEVARLEAAMFKLFEDEEYEEQEEVIAEIDYLIGQLEDVYMSDATLIHNAKQYIVNNKSWSDLKLFVLQEIEVNKEFEGKGLGSFLLQEFIKDNLTFTSKDCLAILPGVITGRCGRTQFQNENEIDSEELAEAKEDLIHKFYMPQLSKVTKPKLVASKHYRYIYC